MARKRMGTKDEALDRRIGVRIFRERQRRELTIPALAQRATLHPNTVQRAENGMGMSVRTLHAIAQVLDVTVDALIS